MDYRDRFVGRSAGSALCFVSKTYIRVGGADGVILSRDKSKECEDCQERE